MISHWKKGAATVVVLGAIGASMFAVGADTASAAAAYNGACGSGYRVIDQHKLKGGTIFLTFNGSRNCVVTVRSSPGRKLPMVAQVGISSDQRPDAIDVGDYSKYAGPIYSPKSAHTCIDWGGQVDESSWYDSFAHCG